MTRSEFTKSVVVAARVRPGLSADSDAEGCSTKK